MFKTSDVHRVLVLEIETKAIIDFEAIEII